jgi:hypothetical protein
LAVKGLGEMINSVGEAEASLLWVPTTHLGEKSSTDIYF